MSSIGLIAIMSSASASQWMVLSSRSLFPERRRFEFPAKSLSPKTTTRDSMTVDTESALNPIAEATAMSIGPFLSSEGSYCVWPSRRVDISVSE